MKSRAPFLGTALVCRNSSASAGVLSSLPGAVLASTMHRAERRLQLVAIQTGGRAPRKPGKINQVTGAIAVAPGTN